MNSDGTDAHRVTPEDFPPTGRARWSPDGQWLLSGVWPEEGQGPSFITDIWGTDIRAMPNVGTDGMWSPDGSMIVSCDAVEGELEGVAGTWRRLLLTNADGSEPEVLVEQFIVHAEVEARYPDEEMLSSHPDFDWHNDVLAWVGPREPVWSPDGSKIAFLAALPFEPEGLYYKNQLEIWVYDLRNDELTQVTDDEVAQHWIRWKP
jgi:Tol biopolymer transport system component